MGNNGDSSGMLIPCRILELTDNQVTMYGRFLTELGAEVIKIETPSGD